MKSSNRPALDQAISCAGTAHRVLVRLALTHRERTTLANSPHQEHRDLFRTAVREAEALVVQLKRIAASEY